MGKKTDLWVSKHGEIRGEIREGRGGMGLAPCDWLDYPASRKVRRGEEKKL